MAKKQGGSQTSKEDEKEMGAQMSAGTFK